MHDAGSLPAAVPADAPAPGPGGVPRDRPASGRHHRTLPLPDLRPGLRAATPCRGPA